MIGVSELDPNLSFPCRHEEGPVFPALQSRGVQQPVPHDRHQVHVLLYGGLHGGPRHRLGSRVRALPLHE